jgi:excisionase family DNA binding protein
MKVARAKGRLRGKQPKLNPKQEAHLVSLVHSGEYSTLEVAELFGVGRSTVYRAIERQRIAALADRGWSSSGPTNIWAVTSVEEIANTARMVVGADEPFVGRRRVGTASARRRAWRKVARAHRSSLGRRRPVLTLRCGCASVAVGGRASRVSSVGLVSCPVLTDREALTHHRIDQPG